MRTSLRVAFGTLTSLLIAISASLTTAGPGSAEPGYELEWREWNIGLASNVEPEYPVQYTSPCKAQVWIGLSDTGYVTGSASIDCQGHPHAWIKPLLELTKDNQLNTIDRNNGLCSIAGGLPDDGCTYRYNGVADSNRVDRGHEYCAVLYAQVASLAMVYYEGFGKACIYPSVTSGGGMGGGYSTGGTGSGTGGGGGDGTPPPASEQRADLNGDGIADLARAHANGHLYVYPGRGGSGGAEPGTAFWAPRDHGSDWGGTVSIALGDLNRDGIADLARVHENGHLYVYPGRGGSGGVEPGTAFWAPRDLGPDWGGTVSIALGDLNRDGIADLARVHSNGHLYVYPGRGGVEPDTAFWAPRDHGPDWGGTVSIGLGDLNGDGIAELARAHGNGHLYVYPGRGGSGGVEPGTAFWAPRDHGPDWGGTVAIAL